MQIENISAILLLMKESLIISPSILSADFSDIRNEIEEISSAGLDYVHLDVMDGMFVPNITFGPKFISDLRSKTDLVFDAHLMIESPERYIHDFASAGCDIITVHAEATRHLDRTVNMIREEGKSAGVSINPATSLSEIEEILPSVDYVLIMSVNPGFGGQRFISYIPDKIRRLSEMRADSGYSFLINVDGGVNLSTIELLKGTGLDMVVTGSAFFNAPDKEIFVHTLMEKFFN